jgi:hypothetical protein
MPSESSVRKNRLADRIKDEGYRSVMPYKRYIRLYKSYIRVDNSDRCGAYVRVGGKVKCVMLTLLYSDVEWRRLVKL